MATIEKRLLNDFQRDFPLVSRPYAVLAETLGVSEDEVLEILRRLTADGRVSRVGPVFRPGRVGASTLAAMAVPEDRLEAVAALVSAHEAVNHNYEREHRLNLWFVINAEDETAVARVIAEIEQCTGLAVLNLPMLADYHLDLGFELP